MQFSNKMTQARTTLLVTTLAAGATLVGCAGTNSNQTPQLAQSATGQQTITLFVAANATDPVNDLITSFKKAHPGINVTTNFAGTQILETQLEQGADADFFLSADLAHMQKMQGEGLIDQYRMVSKTEPVIIVPKSNPAGVHSLQDLGNKPVQLLIGVDSVPVGKYARQVLTNANSQYGSEFSQNALSHVVSMETNVKQILQKVALGEADAGVVYLTDVTDDLKGKVTVIPIPKALNVTATNYIAVPKKAPHVTLGHDFLQYVLSADGQRVFQKFGYDTSQ